MIVSALWVYPLKGARGVAVDAAPVTPRGIAADRRWMIVAQDGRFCSARTHPRMLALRAFASPGRLHVEASGQAHLDVSEPGPEAPRRRCSVWDSVLDLPEAVEARAWVSQALGTPAALVYQPEDVHRATDPDWAPGHEVSLADGYPLLLATEASRRHLEAEAGLPLDMRRFRPNVVVEGAPGAWDEDRWHDLQIGAVRFRNVKPCARCEVTTYDPDTLERSKEPLRTLARVRKHGAKVLFGVNLVPLSAGSVQVGAAVIIES